MELQHGEYLVSTDRDRLDLDMIQRFLAEESYWARGIPIDVIARAADHSLCFGVYYHGRQVAFGRVVTDYATFGHIMDVFVLPAIHDSRGNVDGLPNVLLEAMASGVPVVSTAVSGIPLAITSGVEGLLVPEQDDAALEEALGELLTDPDRRRALGDAARRRVVGELTWDRVAARYRRAYESVLGAAA